MDWGRIGLGAATGGLSELWNPTNYIGPFQAAGSMAQVPGALGSIWQGTGGRLKNYFFDQPANDVKAAYDEAMKRAQQGGQDVKNFLMDREARAQGFYSPIQKMFENAYGTQGIRGPQVPKAPGVGPMQSMYGGSR